MKWTVLLAPAAVAASVLGMFLVEYHWQEQGGDLAAICLQWAGIMAAVAIAANLAFLLAFYTKNDALGILGVLAGAGAAIFCVYLVLSYAFDPLDDIPLVIQGLFCLFYAVQLTRGVLQRGGGRLRPSRGTIVAVLLACGGCFGVYKLHESTYGAIPFRYLTMTWRDVGGMASIRTKRFLVQFEGYAFGPCGGSGGYIVDGRWGRWFSFAPPQECRLGEGVSGSYSEQDRLFTLEHGGQRLVYSHPRRVMIAGGKEYPLTGGPLRFVVKRSGEVIVTDLSGGAEAFSGAGSPPQQPGKTAGPDGPSAASASAEKATTYDAFFYDGTKIGHMQTLRTTERGKVRQKTSLFIRLGHALIDRITETLETEDGRPLWFRSEARGGPADAKEGKIIDGKLTVTTIRGDSRTVDERPWPAGALLPEGTDLLMRRKGLSPGTTFSFIQFDTGDLQPMAIKVVVGDRKTRRVLGRTESLHEVTQIQAGRFSSTMYVNDDYDARQAVMNLAGLEIECAACSKEYAHTIDWPLDMSEKAGVEIPRDMSGYDTAARIRYSLIPDGKTDFEIPSTGVQQAAPSSDGGLSVVVTPRPLPVGDAFPYQGSDEEALKALEPTHYLQCRDPEVMQRAREAVGPSGDVAEAVPRLGQLVRDLIVVKFDDTDVDTATDILKAGRGACRQHAVLLASFCRSVGIPARLVGGLTYVADSIELRGHSWAQVFVGGKWIDYDPIQGGFDAGHVALRVWQGDPNYPELAFVFGHFQVRDVVLEGRWRDRWPLAGALGAVCVVAWLSRPGAKRRQPAGMTDAGKDVSMTSSETPSPGDQP
jgi:hypothetical protein